MHTRQLDLVKSKQLHKHSKLKMTNLPQIILIIWLVGFDLLALTLIEVDGSDVTVKSDNSNFKSNLTLRDKFKLPKLFDFNYFKSLFNRHYASVEEIVRRRLYLARAFRVFASAIKYKYKKLNSYLGINERADWTADEIKQTYINAAQYEGRKSSCPIRIGEARLAASGSLKDASVSLADLKEKLLDIEQHKEQPGYKEMAQELSKSGLRLRRDIEDVRDIGLDDLVPAEVESEVEQSVPPVLDKKDSLLQENENKGVTKQGTNFLLSIVNATRDLFRNSPKPKIKNDRIDTLPDAIFSDLRLSDCYQPVKDQGRCGSCAIFSTLALYEWLLCKKTGETIKLSEQYVIDCGERIPQMQGCKGSPFPKVSAFFKKFGFEIEANYPYRMREDTCPYDKDAPNDTMGYIRFKDYGFTEVPILFAGMHLADNPLVINLYINEDFSFYKGGVDPLAGCYEYQSIHTVLIVGSGRESGESYWLIRNSYGSNSWGENGHYKLSKQTSCIMYDTAFKLEAEPKENFIENVNSNYDGGPILRRVQQYKSIWSRFRILSVL